MVAARRFLARCSQGFTWQRVGGVIAFCALYGTLFSLNAQTGGAPQSAAAYLAAFAAALTLFLPVFFAVIVTANIAPERAIPRAIVLGLAVAAGLAPSVELSSPTMRLMAACSRSRFLVFWA